MIMQRRRSWVALCSTVDTYSASARETFGKLSGFPREWVDSAPEDNCRPALLSSTHVVDHGSGLIKTGFADIDAPRAVFPTIVFTQNGEVCTVDASAVEQFFLEDWTLFLRTPCFAPCILQYFSSRHVALGDFLGAFDDEEFFVVEGSGEWRGRRE